MFKSLKMCLLVLIAGIALALGACQSAKMDHAAMMPSDKAITCSKCQVTFVNYPQTNDKGRVIAYAKHPEMVCPECRTAAENFFKTGEFKHTCSVCGDTMDMCATH